MPRLDRRRILQAGGAGLIGAWAGGSGVGRGDSEALRLKENVIGRTPFTLTAETGSAQLVASGVKTPIWSYDGTLFPVLRMQRGETANIALHNTLPEHTSVHWHGVRVANAMDGVPYLTQSPVQTGETFAYSFAPPDAGTFFFHPHCATSEQVGRGLVGVLIVDGDTREPFDDDLALVLKDWRIDDSGAYLPFTTLEGTSRAGTYGTLRTVNGLVTPRYTLPRNANVRLRLVNIDPTRIANIRIDGAEAHVIAIDGNAVMPFALDGWRLGPAMRLDLAVRTRDSGTATVSDYQAATPVPLTTLDFQGEAKRSRMWQPLLRAQLPEPDLARAQHCQLELGAGVGLDAPVPELKPIVFSDGRTFDPTDSLCLAGTSLWTLNGQSWPAGGHERLPPPLFSFRRGASIVFELFNATPHAHPLHVHGHTMRFLSSTRLQRPPHWADTILVMPNERVTVAFVADNPGRWMIHCHIVEHQEAGMMGWFDVS